jgi:hypothetical protein
MKKMILVLSATLAMFAFNGCSSDSHYDNNNNTDYDNYDSNNLTTLFLVDEQGYAYADIPYICDSMYEWSRTAPSGEFSFVEPDTCEFDFTGLDGDFGYTDDEIVRIVDDRNDGKGGIPYECASFGVSSTYSDGSFEYDEDDVCSFYL